MKNFLKNIWFLTFILWFSYQQFCYANPVMPGQTPITPPNKTNNSIVITFVSFMFLKDV